VADDVTEEKKIVSFGPAFGDKPGPIGIRCEELGVLCACRNYVVAEFRWLETGQIKAPFLLWTAT
jgi:hypothetical protein